MLALVLALPLLGSGCGPLVVAGATYGGALLHERRPTRTVLADTRIELQAGNLYFEASDINQHSHISVSSYNLEVLLTGQAQTAAIARRFAEQVARLPKVTKVYNEVEIGPTISLTRQSQDTYLGSRAKLALADIKMADFDPLRVKVKVENGVVYLMGLVTPTEAEAVVDKVRRIPGVVRVVRLFKFIASDPAARHAG
jgi:osmotically-inducible protein OsmY